MAVWFIVFILFICFRGTHHLQKLTIWRCVPPRSKSHDNTAFYNHKSFFHHVGSIKNCFHAKQRILSIHQHQQTLPHSHPQPQVIKPHSVCAVYSWWIWEQGVGSTTVHPVNSESQDREHNDDSCTWCLIWYYHHRLHMKAAGLSYLRSMEYMCWSVLPFSPIYRVGYSEN